MGDRAYAQVLCRAKDVGAFEEVGFGEQEYWKGLPEGVSFLVDQEANYGNSSSLGEFRVRRIAGVICGRLEHASRRLPCRAFGRPAELSSWLFPGKYGRVAGRVRVVTLSAGAYAVLWRNFMERAEGVLRSVSNAIISILDKERDGHPIAW